MADQNQNDDKKITKAVDKLVMGMVIGGAIGSVLGMAFAPKSGKQSRKIVKEKALDVKEKVEEVGGRFIQDHHEEIQEAKHLLKGKSKGVFLLMKKALQKKRIPNEQD